jgi:hypothetical protein
MSDRSELLCLDLQVAERLRKKRLAREQADVAAAKARALFANARLPSCARAVRTWARPLSARGVDGHVLAQ